MRGALCYEFELATSANFNAAAVIWSNVRNDVAADKACTPADAAGGTSTETAKPPLRVPAASVDVALPWATGKPYALYAHARAITRAGVTTWSRPFGFNMQWSTTPTQLSGANGLVQWTPVEGATGYQVMFQGASFKKVVSTPTNVADTRELWAFHDASWYGSVEWRVRAVRTIGNAPDGLPTTSSGPWSAVFTSPNPDTPGDGEITLMRAISDAVSVHEVARAHQLIPALTWSGTTGIDGQAHTFFRAYVSSDPECVNTVFRGSIVASPAYAPRSTGPLKLPTSDAELTEAATTLLEDGTEGTTLAADATKISSSEGASDATEAGTAAAGAAPGTAATGLNLPDVDFPATRYYYTVVGVDMLSDAKSNSYKWVDAELPQDVCATGRVLGFGKKVKAVVTSSPTPLVTGLAPDGTLLTGGVKRPVVYSTPLITWLPAIGATSYEVQWSRTGDRWRAEDKVVTHVTSAMPGLTTGKWYYRIRGVGQTPTVWSSPVAVTVAAPTFRVVPTTDQPG